MYTRVLVDRGEVSPSFATDDRIFLGEGLFETLKVASSNPCFSFLHWQRLARSAQQLGIPFDLTFDDWQEHLVQQIKRDNLYHGGIKVILSGGSAPRGLAERGQISQLVLQTFNYTVQQNPLRLISVPWLRDANNPIYRYKTVNYLEAILARRDALDAGADDALFFNTDLFATETTCANLFLIKNDELFTPKVSDGVLPGITRSRLISYMKNENKVCVEGSITHTMINEADALFITNSLQGIRVVQSFDGKQFQLAHPMISHFIQYLSEDLG